MTDKKPFVFCREGGCYLWNTVVGMREDQCLKKSICQASSKRLIMDHNIQVKDVENFVKNSILTVFKGSNGCGFLNGGCIIFVF